MAQVQLFGFCDCKIYRFTFSLSPSAKGFLDIEKGNSFSEINVSNK